MPKYGTVLTPDDYCILTDFFEHHLEVIKVKSFGTAGDVPAVSGVLKGSVDQIYNKYNNFCNA